MEKTTILVTGAQGFIGRNLVRSLSGSGHKVVGLGHGEWRESDWRAVGLSDWHSGEVSVDQLDRFAGAPEVIFHCAGGSSVGFSMGQRELDYERTVLSTQAVLEYIRKTSPETKLVYPSSAAVYGAIDQMPINEDSVLDPVSPYGEHKRAAEALCQEASRKYGLRTAIVRLFSVYGPGLRKQLLFDACSKASRGVNRFFGTGEETRDWLYIDDAVALLSRAMQHASTACPIVNGGFGESVAVATLLEEVFRRFDPEGPVPVFTGETKPGDPMHYRADISRALEWGWRPKTAWRQGLEQYLDWWLSENSH